MRGRRTAIGLTLTLMLLITGIAAAQEMIEGDQCTVNADETVTGNVFVLCRALVIDGRIEGNLIGAATTAVIRGTVSDGVYLLAGQLDVTGTLGEDLHFGGGVLNLGIESEESQPLASLHGDLISLSLSTTIAPNVTIPGSIISRSYQMVIHGAVDQEINFWGSGLTIDGPVGGDVNATVGDPAGDGGWLLETLFSLGSVKLSDPGLHVTAQGSVKGQLTYTSPAEGKIEGKLDHDPVFTAVVITPAPLTLGEEDSARSFGLYLTSAIREFVTLALIGIIGLLFTPRLLQGPMHNLRRRPFTSLGIGIPAFFMPLVIAFIILILTLLLMFLLALFQLTDLALAGGALLGVLNVSGTGIFYFVAIFIARVIVSFAFGRMLVRAVVGDDTSGRIQLISLLIGVGIMAAVGSIPLPVGPFTFGGILNAVVLALGLGALLIFVENELRRLRTPPPVPAAYPRSYASRFPALPERTGDAHPVPPPMLDDQPLPPGMDNLPDGFKWWDDDRP